MKPIIAYYRVSTKKQGASGLGLEGQRKAIEEFCKANGAEIVAEYQEVESGKRADRPELAKALAHARRSKSTLVVAKLDRLARNVAFLSALIEAGCEFVACDMPSANRFTIHILAAVAEHEARMISDRTKAALEAAKRRGIKLGSQREGHWAGREAARLDGAKKGAKVAGAVLKESANAAYTDLYPIVKDLRQQGQTFQTIADKLNEMGHTTRRGKPWNASQVLRVSRRAV